MHSITIEFGEDRGGYDIRVLIAAGPYLVVSKPPAKKCLLQFEVCGDQCSVLELLTVTDTRYFTTTGKGTRFFACRAHDVIWRTNTS